MSARAIFDMAQRLVAHGGDLSDYEFKIHPSAAKHLDPYPPKTLLGLPLVIDADCPHDQVFLVRASVREP